MPVPRDQSQAFHRDFAAALAFATHLHANQLRKETDIPYISHLISVAGLVLEHGGSRDQAIAALLHDSIEDQAKNHKDGPDGLRQEISERFGANVLSIVEGCTDRTDDEERDWRARKEAYVAHLGKADSQTRLVSCADKLHNARAILADLRIAGNALWGRFNGGREGTLWYYHALAEEFERGGSSGLAGELVRTVKEIERLAESLGGEPTRVLDGKNGLDFPPPEKT